MTPEAKKLLETAALDARIVDVDAIRLAAFDEIVRKVATASDAERAVLEMRRLKPGLFEDWGTMNDEEFDSQEQRMRNALFQPAKPLEPDFDLKAIDYAALSEREREMVDTTIRAVNHGDQSTASQHFGALKSILARQRAEGVAK
jgi:hypothetical protein